MMDVTIFIPTRGRVGISRQITVRELRDNGKIQSIIVSPPPTK